MLECLNVIIGCIAFIHIFHLTCLLSWARSYDSQIYIQIYLCNQRESSYKLVSSTTVLKDVHLNKYCIIKFITDLYQVGSFLFVYVFISDLLQIGALLVTLKVYDLSVSCHRSVVVFFGYSCLSVRYGSLVIFVGYSCLSVTYGSLVNCVGYSVYQ